MQIRTVSTQPMRFGQGKQSAYKVANGFLSMHDTVTTNIKTAMGTSKNGFIQGLSNGFQWMSSNFLKHDYHDMSALGPFGRIITGNPKGAVLAIISFMIGGRLVHALERAPRLPDGTKDLRELRDIKIRDLTTCALVFFALNPLTEWVGARLQDIRHIQLRHGAGSTKAPYGHLKTYSELVNEFTVSSENRLEQILASTKNHGGLKKAIDHALKNSHLTDAGRQKLTDLKNLITTLGHSKPSQRNLKDAAKKGFEIIQDLDADRRLVISGQNAAKALLKQDTQVFARKVPQFADMFAHYARNSRVGADAFAFSLMVGVLGWGVTAFNEWYTEREFHNKKSQFQPLPKQSNKMPQSAMAYTPINSTFQTATFPSWYQYNATQTTPQTF